MNYDSDHERVRKTHQIKMLRLKDTEEITTEEENGVFHRSPKGDLNSDNTKKNPKRTPPTVPERYQLWAAKQHLINPYVKYYAITVSPHGRYDDKQVVYNAMLHIFSLYKGLMSCLYIFEKSKNGKWHTHGLLAMKDKCKFVKVRNYPLVKYHIEQYVPGNWIDYISKDLPSEIYQVNHYPGDKIVTQQHDVRNNIE